MATINDLKNSDTVIDTSAPNSTVLDGIPGENTVVRTNPTSTRVQQAMSNVRVRPQVQQQQINVAGKPKQVIKKNINEDPSEQPHVINKKSIIQPKNYNNANNATGGLSSRSTTIADLSSLPTEDPNAKKIPVKTPAQQILEGEDSPFATYLKEKKEYFAEKQKEYDEEEALNEYDNEIDGVITDDTRSDNISVISSEDESFVDSEDLLNKDEDNNDYIIGTDNLEEIDIMTDNIENNDVVVDDDVEEVMKANDISTVETDNSIEIDDTEDNTNEDIVEDDEDNNDISASDENISTIEDTDDEDNAVDNLDDEEEHKVIVEKDVNKEDEVPDPSQDEVIEKLRKLASEKIVPVSKKLDLSTFTIVKKPTANTKFLNENPVKVAKWVLPGQGTIVKMKEMSGSELELLREFNEDATSVSSMTKKYRCIYDHIASPKPSTFEAWCKSTPLTDIDHYFFGLYIAAFKGANFIPVDCQNKACKETYLTDDIPFMNMVKFETDEDKKKFNKIYQTEEILSNTKGLYTSELVPLSDRVAIEFRDFSLYSALELAGLDSDFRTKHQNILYFVPHIDALYMINQDDKTLTPIGFKVYPDSPSKTAKSRILKYESVLSTLSADEFNIIRSYISSLGDHVIKMSYQYPQFECPKCHTKSEVVPMQAEQMVFTRYQLATLVTTVLK